MTRTEAASGGPGGAACEALALVWQALSRLEVGDVGVMAFGEGRPRVLHALAEPLDDEAGARALSGLTFAAGRSDTLAALEGAAAVLEAGRDGGGGASGEHQLLVIVTDGLVAQPSERPALRRRVADLAELGVMVVLVIVDDADPRNSVTRTQTVEFGPGGSLSRRPYLEGFPVPNYVVAGSTAELPSAIAGAVRQWVEASRGRD